MKIKRKIQNEKLFKDINISDVFYYDDNYYIRIKTLEHGTCCINAIDLSYGEWRYFKDEELVAYVNAELCVSD